MTWNGLLKNAEFGSIPRGMNLFTWKARNLSCLPMHVSSDFAPQSVCEGVGRCHYSCSFWFIGTLIMLNSLGKCIVL